MNIMLYRWDACGERTLYNNLCEMGHRVSVNCLKIKNYDRDPEFTWKFMVELEKSKCDAVFTLNYFPLISTICMTRGIKYISWVFDSPHMTLYSKTIYNACNAIFLFDRNQYLIYSRDYGVPTVHYMPLGVDTDYYDKLFCGKQGAEDAERYHSELSFVGTFYTDSRLTEEIEDLQRMPEYYKGYLDGMVESQLKVFGYHFIPEMLRGETEEEISRYYAKDLGRDYFAPFHSILTLLVERKAAVLERIRLLEAVRKKFPLDVYSGADTSAMPDIQNRGYVDYYTQMPKVFRYSRINLNITMRSITSGMNLRTMDILGCGGFLLTNYQPETAEYFEDGKEVVMYGSQEELLEKIGYYLAHEEERREIARNGYLKVREQFSYQKKLRELFDIAEGKASGKL